MMALQSTASGTAKTLQGAARQAAIKFAPIFRSCKALQRDCKATASKSEGLIKTPDCNGCGTFAKPCQNSSEWRVYQRDQRSALSAKPSVIWNMAALSAAIVTALVTVTATPDVMEAR